MARRDHVEIVQALEDCIKWRQDNPARRGKKYTASNFPHAWLFYSSVYGPYRWGVFYSHRYYGFTLSRNWQAAFDKVKGAPWQDVEEYTAWREAWQDVEEYTAWREANRERRRAPHP